jgi:hypothetical protein
MTAALGESREIFELRRVERWVDVDVTAEVCPERHVWRVPQTEQRRRDCPHVDNRSTQERRRRIMPS